MKLEWEKIFESINSKKFNSDLRSFNYRVLVDGLCLSIKVKDKLSNNCFLYEEGGGLIMENLESRKHLLIRCETTQILFNKIKHKFKEKYDNLSEKKSILFIGLV